MTTREHRTAADAPLLCVENLTVDYGRKHERVRVVDGVSFDINRGETLGLVGESGCGKSTVARTILQLTPASGGSVALEGRELIGLSEKDLRPARRRVQMVFQDPISSLNPRRRIREIVGEPLRLYEPESDADQLIRDMLDDVSLDVDLVGNRRPHELSGGQCQRVSIARALILRPELLLCDEPVSALDVSVQAQILNLLEDLKDRFALTLLFISHDLGVVHNICDRVAVMYLGRLCEVGPVEQVFQTYAHPYTQLLLSSMPGAPAGDDLPSVKAEPPSVADPPSGCRFRTRCPYATERCTNEEPQLRVVDDGHLVACHYAFGADTIDEPETVESAR